MRSPSLFDVWLAELDDERLDELAARLAPRLVGMLDRSDDGRPWLNAVDAAAYLACSRERLYDLVQLGKLTPRRDGRRLLFRRQELAGYLETAA
jgi:excisionase family DNA binding protein